MWIIPPLEDISDISGEVQPQLRDGAQIYRTREFLAANVNSVVKRSPLQPITGLVPEVG